MNGQQALREFKAGIFQALANPTRIGIVELLRDEGEIHVGRICDALGIEQSNASQHLSVLRTKSIVVARKDGNWVFYRLRDPILGQILDLLKQYFHTHLDEALATLQELEPRTPRKRK